jgi:hypothetical protein
MYSRVEFELTICPLQFNAEILDKLSGRAGINHDEKEEGRKFHDSVTVVFHHGYMRWAKTRLAWMKAFEDTGGRFSHSSGRGDDLIIVSVLKVHDESSAIVV